MIFSSLIAIMIGALPWLAGGVIAIILFRPLRASWVATDAVGLFGFGSSLGYIAVSAMIWTPAQWQFPMLANPYLLTGLILLACVLLLIAYARRTLQQTRQPAEHQKHPAADWRGTALSSVGLLLLVFAAFFQLFNVASGWDVLGHWTGFPHHFLENAQDPTAITRYHHRHPITLKLVAAWSGWAASTGQLSLAALLPWFLFWLSGAMSIWSLGSQLAPRDYYRHIAVIAYLTVPLLENHAHLSGYGELPLSVFFVQAMSAGILFLRFGGLPYLILFGAILFCVATMKNTGVFYLGVLVFGFIFARPCKNKPRKTFLSAVALLLLSGVLFKNLESVLELARIQYLHVEETLVFAGRVVTFSDQYLGDVIANEVFALFVQLSFSVLPLLYLATCGYVLFCRKALLYFLPELRFLILVLTATLIGLCVSQFTDHGFNNAVVGNDTGNSRFHLPFAAAAPLLIFFVNVICQNNPKTSSSIRANY